ncbi:MAG: sigma-70 family RNA polymerase sigma factor [Gemmatimonas sp.]|nr:sigma-70 family RNA polymerase sigma factor [Gemmatimonas sp.]
MTKDEATSGSAPQDAPDNALVRATLGGDETAFGRLVRRYIRKAMAVALEYAGSREDAEDVVQDTFKRVLENLDRYDPSRPFEPWFFTVLRNTARNAAKRRRVRDHEALTTEYASASPDPFETTHRRELRRQIDEAVERLPAAQRKCFRLCIVEGLSSVEVASALGLAESTVRVQVFKARRALQRLLDTWAEEVGNI